MGIYNTRFSVGETEPRGSIPLLGKHKKATEVVRAHSLRPHTALGVARQNVAIIELAKIELARIEFVKIREIDEAQE